MADSPKPLAHVRPAILADLQRILEIVRAAPTAARWPEPDYEIALTNASAPRRLLVAEIERQAEGFLVARSVHPLEWEIENVVVAETARRMGLGFLLLKTFLEQTSAERLTNQALVFHLEVRESNLPARRLYEKSGFRLDKRRQSYYRHPDEDALLYSLSLQ